MLNLYIICNTMVGINPMLNSLHIINIVIVNKNKVGCQVFVVFLFMSVLDTKTFSCVVYILQLSPLTFVFV